MLLDSDQSADKMNMATVCEFISTAISERSSESQKIPSVLKNIDTDSGGISLSQFDKTGITMVLRYASRILTNIPTDQMERDLIKLISKTSDNRADIGFDWFAATSYILNAGDLSSTLKDLDTFSQCTDSIYLYPRVSLLNSHGIPLVYSISCHFIESIIETELPLLSSAFSLSGCTPSQITTRWIREMFWNVLDFPDIANYVLFAMACGIDYQVYFCVALFKHIEKDVMRHAREGDLILYLVEGPLDLGGRKFPDVEFMSSLESKYRVEILERMNNEQPSPES
jgi:hypothetical protein